MEKIGLDKVSHMRTKQQPENLEMKTIGLDKVAHVRIQHQPENSEMNKIGLDRAYYKQKAQKSCKKGLDKKASTDSTGVSQLKQRKTTTRKKYTAEGTGLGAAGGGFAGYKLTKALGPKWNIPSTLAGIALGGLTGRHVGRKGSKTKTKSIEGVVKRQEKRKDSPAKLPSLKRENVKGLLAYNS